MRHVTIHYTPCHHPPNHIFMSSIDFLWLIACISHHKIPAGDFRMIHSKQNNMLSYIMSLQTNIFGVTTFTFHLKILFKKFSRQRAGYHLVDVTVSSEYIKTRSQLSSKVHKKFTTNKCIFMGW
jgi:hypothetical protein